jgi:hypothetical protein
MIEQITKVSEYSFPILLTISVSTVAISAWYGWSVYKTKGTYLPEITTPNPYDLNINVNNLPRAVEETPVAVNVPEINLNVPEINLNVIDIDIDVTGTVNTIIIQLPVNNIFPTPTFPRDLQMEDWMFFVPTNNSWHKLNQLQELEWRISLEMLRLGRMPMPDSMISLPMEEPSARLICMVSKLKMLAKFYAYMPTALFKSTFEEHLRLAEAIII